MANKILKTLTNNFGFKILAVVLACVLWLVVYNVDDPNITQTYTIGVTIENASTVTELNKCYEILDGTNTVTFAVTGKRSVLKNLDDSDFKAVADLSRMVLNEDGETASVPIDISSTRYNSSLSYPSKKYLEIALEDLMSKQIVVTADTTGTVADGYALGDVTVTNPNVLKISGPASIVSTIASAVATIDVDGMSVNLSDNVIPILYDEDGNVVDTTRLTISSTTVTVSARILSVGELTLELSTVGTPGGDYSVVSITSDPAVIQVKGLASTLNQLTTLTIPGDLFDVTGLEEDLVTTIDITEFLPDGVELVDSAQAKVKVTVRIEPYKTRTCSISMDNIEVEGLEDGYTLTFSDTSVSVSISALQANLGLLSSSDITGTIDVSGLGEGTHQVELVLDLDEENYAYQTVTVQVEITSPDSGQDDEPAVDDGSESTDDVPDDSEETESETETEEHLP